MRFSQAAFVPALLGLTNGALIPRSYGVPHDNGFPNSNAEQQLAIAKQAGGRLPDGPLPAKLGKDSQTALQLIAMNEQFEVAYFNSLLHNITHEVQGYKSHHQKELTKTFKTVLAQEELHALGAVSILKNVKAFAPSPCEYSFPVNDLKDSIALAETFTALVLGALQGANKLFAMDGDFAPVQLISSVIGQEGEQNGFYRYWGGQVPSESPFLTYVPAPFAFTALQSFIVPGSCPFDLKKIPLPTFPAIMTNGQVVAKLEPKDQTLCFSTDLTGSSEAAPYVGKDGSGLYFTYSTGQLTPISVKLENVRWSGSKVTFEAKLPFEEYVMEGFSHGALTIGNGFADGDAIVPKALAGPAVIQVAEAI